MRLLNASAALVVVAVCWLQRSNGGGPEPFTIHASVIRVEGARWDPDPVWVSIKWEAASESAFVKIRSELIAPNKAPFNSDKSGTWARKSRSAYKDWYADHQNSVKLFRVSSYLAITANLDTAFAKSKEFRGMGENVNYGFSVLRAENVPPSYEFCRRAYMAKAGDTHLHRFQDLAARLLKRSPIDRGVALTMVKEYQQRGPDAVFEKAMFGALAAASKSSSWRYWDDHWIAHAWRYHAWHHHLKSSYDKGIAYMDKAIASTPKGVDAAPMIKMKADFLRERELPNFGVPQFAKKKGGGN